MFYTYRLTFDFQHSLNELRKKKNYTHHSCRTETEWNSDLIYQCICVCIRAKCQQNIQNNTTSIDLRFIQTIWCQLRDSLENVSKFTWKCTVFGNALYFDLGELGAFFSSCNGNGNSCQFSYKNSVFESESESIAEDSYEKNEL